MNEWLKKYYPKHTIHTSHGSIDICGFPGVPGHFMDALKYMTVESKPWKLQRVATDYVPEGPYEFAINGPDYPKEPPKPVVRGKRVIMSINGQPIEYADDVCYSIEGFGIEPVAFEPIKFNIGAEPVCECGGDKTKSTHYHWCPKYE